MQLQELHKAAQHKRELELLKIKEQQEENAKVAFKQSEEGQGLASWIAKQRAVWEARSDRLTAYVESLHQQEQPQ
jgi:hypothetical protein